MGIALVGRWSGPGQPFQNPANPEAADGGHEQHQHLPESDPMIELEDDREGGNPQAQQLSDIAARFVLAKGPTG
jgi:hypothetical protein